MTLLAMTTGFDKHLTHRQSVLLALPGIGLRVKFSEAVFTASSLVALRHFVGEAEVLPDPDRGTTILDIPHPVCVTSVMSFLGMVGFYRSHVCDFGEIAAPLQYPSKSQSPSVYKSDCDSSWPAKSALISAPVLRLPDWTQPCHVCNYWSKAALGAVLSQKDPNTEFKHVIAFASRSCSPAKANCPQLKVSYWHLFGLVTRSGLTSVDILSMCIPDHAASQ